MTETANDLGKLLGRIKEKVLCQKMEADLSALIAAAIVDGVPPHGIVSVLAGALYESTAAVLLFNLDLTDTVIATSIPSTRADFIAQHKGRRDSLLNRIAEERPAEVGEQWDAWQSTTTANFDKFIDGAPAAPVTGTDL